MHYNSSVRVVRGRGLIDSTVHVRKTPTEKDVAQLVRMYGKLTDALLAHLKGCRNKPRTNAEYEDLAEQISIVEYALENFGAKCNGQVEVGGTYWITLIQPKLSPSEERLKTLSDLFYETFAGSLRPKSGPRAKARPDYVFHARPYIRKLAREGGDAYDKALTALRYAYTGVTPYEQERAYTEAVQAVIPPLSK
jgi:hypothetical protein